MKIDDIRWYAVERSELPKALFGKKPERYSVSGLEGGLLKGNGLALGYLERDNEQEYCPPALIVLEDDVVAEVLSWVRTYAPTSFPLNQFSRVVLRSDWERLYESLPRLTPLVTRSDIWASVILGELLAQGDLELSIGSIPLSWCASCFSTAIARAAIVYQNDGGAIDSCVRRLVVLEKDEAFSTRSISILGLKPVWGITMESCRQRFGVTDVVGVLLHQLRDIDDGEPLWMKDLAASLFSSHSPFLQDSVEGRVVAFQQLCADLDHYQTGKRPTRLAFVSIAAGAFLVGRGTSHAFLLSRLGRKWAEAYLWFGLMAGLAGPTSWDQVWSLTVKGAEKYLRGGFDWSGGSGADLSWAEYSWVSRTFVNKELFSELPRSLPKALTVEVLPGTTCQLRLNSEVAAPLPEMDRVSSTRAAHYDLELKETLDQLEKLAAVARSLLAHRVSEQMSLTLDDPDIQGKNVPSRRRRRP